MRITAARLQPYALPLKAAWQSAAGALSVRSGWLIRLETDGGLIGYGECAPLPSHGSEDPTASEHALTRWLTVLPGQWVETALAELAAPTTYATPAARAAVETALLDLLAQQAGSPLANYLCQQECSRSIAVNAVPGAATKVSEAAITDAVRAGFGVIKLKVGLAAVAEEIEALRRIAAPLPAGVKLRLDANRAWSMANAEIFCDTLAGLPIESIEEPLAQPEPESLHKLQRQLPFPIALDESWRAISPDILFDAPPVHRLIIKLAVTGGLLPALVLAQRAHQAGLSCVVTTGIDSACGTLAATHLAAAIDNGLAHGLATSAWFAKDTGAPRIIEAGMLNLPDTHGLGFMPFPGQFCRQ